MFVLSTEDIKFQNINVEQVVSTIKKFRVYQNIHGRNTSLNLLNELDDKCSRRVKHLETREILEILLAYMRTIPNRITEYKYYNSAVGELTNRLHMLSKTELINLIFYIGLGKKLVKPQLLRNCINSFKETSIKCLTTEELCIICNATFKASTKIDNKVFLDKVVTHLEDNLSILQDPAFFVTLLKTIRHNRYQTENLLTTISCTIFFNKTHERYSFTALSHISALYSDYLHYDQNLLKLFTTRCISLLKEKEFISTNEYSPDIPRMKDIKRLLWCLSNLNFKNLNLTDIENVIVPNILKRIEAGELKNDSFSLIEIVLYLWMLNYRTYELMPYALSDENISFVKESNSPTRHRLNLLLSCIFYEDRGLFREFNILPDFTTVYDMKYQLEKRPLLPRIMKNLTTIGAWQNVNKFIVMKLKQCVIKNFSSFCCKRWRLCAEENNFRLTLYRYF
ncbi:hypothetical protein JTB14_032225 [Gonioctena quinquepunctata]|nr:hypothetical protein JTB14_032225 [Gonioctena quinquepunctata]